MCMYNYKINAFDSCAGGRRRDRQSERGERDCSTLLCCVSLTDLVVLKVQSSYDSGRHLSLAEDAGLDKGGEHGLCATTGRVVHQYARVVLVNDQGISVNYGVIVAKYQVVR